ncbi:type IV-A pilus assembly ATPase PilB [Alkalilimnicola ehrlichii MLHE-1]|uniref:Type IV-A pilus assembly ATPase PilB n=1 Tax=Alkalilimnicola ehrlichii (strain ATCC BAA-1101 / DSM 17681 / MLHE-1) TaxID=187272 RepID=Q0A6W6_ALKEH|nr:type IV-A pilus assembly ATPase PilB [Alkalilimnicola ehrlichii]ABI57421.1 type IV-A pilus assembly ATPase PilB [Alkalilimnicola ehrlichii MLHE-1]
MVTANPSVRLSGLAGRLVREGLLDEATARKHTEQAVKQRRPLISHLVEAKVLPGHEVIQQAAIEFGIPALDLAAVEPDINAVKLVSEKLIRTHQALPLFRRGKRLFLGVVDPTNLDALDEIKFHTGLTTEAILVEPDKLTQVMERALDAAAGGDAALKELDLDEDLEHLSVGGDEPREEREVGIAGEGEKDDAPVVRFVNKLLLDAIRKGASDIHFEPFEKEYRVRFRQDGILYEVSKPPVNLGGRLAARLKVMSRMDIAEKRVPQDGRIKMNISRNRAIDFRVSTCPTLFGEKVVLRILDPSSAQMGIDSLGYEPEQKQRYLEALSKPYGMILVTGPTGSGKTVSLYTGLHILNTPDRNISTAEDPSEINMPGVNQVNINPKAGLTFANTLRAFLRQDPDVIMVGEIRDLETAEIAIKAAQTGHLVLSTLHTNDAPQTLTRLANMGVPAYNIASSVTLIIAQRLARRLCKHCKVPEEVPRETLLEEGFTEADLEAGVTVYAPQGCEHCTEGYKGRVGIYQVMPVSDAMGRLIMEGGNAMQLADQAAREGIDDLRRSGLRKVIQGMTSLQEVNRVTKD